MSHWEVQINILKNRTGDKILNYLIRVSCGNVNKIEVRHKWPDLKVLAFFFFFALVVLVFNLDNFRVIL